MLAPGFSLQFHSTFFFSLLGSFPITLGFVPSPGSLLLLSTARKEDPAELPLVPHFLG